MKKAACLVLFSVFALYCFGQATSLDTAKKQLLGTWLSRGDSISELVIKADSITTFRFRLNGVTRCTYTLSTQPCEKVIKFPANTGIYLIEKYPDATLCCSMAQISSSSIKIIYPNGNEVEYVNESNYLKEQK